MVRLGKGQAILGGRSNNAVYQSKIYSMTCSNRNCIILLLNRELSVPKAIFVAISISDTITGCITKGMIFTKPQKFSPLTPDQHLVKKPPPLLNTNYTKFSSFYGLSHSTTLKKKDVVFFRTGPNGPSTHTRFWHKEIQFLLQVPTLLYRGYS